MQVHCDEGVANHIGPECDGRREATGEASVGERAGQPLSRDSCVIPGADAVQNAEGNTKRCASASASTTRRGRRTCTYGRSLRGNREVSRSANCSMGWSASGRRGAVADDERTREVRLRHSSEEACEQRREAGCGVGGAKGGDQEEHGSSHTCRAQNRASVSQGLDRVRQAARQRKKERFTALLHHVTIDRLRASFFALKRNAAPGWTV